MDPQAFLATLDAYVDYRTRALLLRLNVVHANELRTRTCLEIEAEKRREMLEALETLLQKEPA